MSFPPQTVKFEIFLDSLVSIHPFICLLLLIWHQAAELSWLRRVRRVFQFHLLPRNVFKLLLGDPEARVSSQLVVPWNPPRGVVIGCLNRLSWFLSTRRSSDSTPSSSSSLQAWVQPPYRGSSFQTLVSSISFSQLTAQLPPHLRPSGATPVCPSHLTLHQSQKTQTHFFFTDPRRQNPAFSSRESRSHYQNETRERRQSSRNVSASAVPSSLSSCKI